MNGGVGKSTNFCSVILLKGLFICQLMADEGKRASSAGCGLPGFGPEILPHFPVHT